MKMSLYHWSLATIFIALPFTTVTANSISKTFPKIKPNTDIPIYIFTINSTFKYQADVISAKCNGSGKSSSWYVAPVSLIQQKSGQAACPIKPKSDSGSAYINYKIYQHSAQYQGNCKFNIKFNFLSGNKGLKVTASANKSSNSIGDFSCKVTEITSLEGAPLVKLNIEGDY